MVIIRPNGLINYCVDIDFNYLNFSFLEIDLEHINKGKRSKLLPKEVADIVIMLIADLKLQASAVNMFGEESCSYYVRTGLYLNDKYKLVFCICSDRLDAIGIITLFRI